MPSSTLAAKQLDVRAGDYATSGSVVSLKTYNTSTSYDFYLPSADPKFLNGADGSEQVADQVLTYDVATDTYVWKMASQNEVFLQGATTSLGSDEHGNVLTVQSETRVVAGDPTYDPALPADQQQFKVEQAFTDQLYNMTKFAASKATVGATVYDKATGVYFDYVAPSDNPGGTTDAQKQAKNKVVVQTYTKPSGSEVEYSKLDLQPTKSDLHYVNAAGEKTGTSCQDNSFSIVSKDKTLVNSEVVASTTSVYPGVGSSTASTSVHRPYDYDLTFGGDSSKFTVSNATKRMSTDMSCIEFGESSSKHRLKVQSGKLYIQKYDSASTSWVGADVVLDTVAGFTASVTLNAPVVSGQDVSATATLAGTFDHWKVMVDDDVSGMQTTADGATASFTGLYKGIHKLVAFAADASNAQVSEKVVQEFTIS